MSIRFVTFMAGVLLLTHSGWAADYKLDNDQIEALGNFEKSIDHANINVRKAVVSMEALKNVPADENGKKDIHQVCTDLADASDAAEETKKTWPPVANLLSPRSRERAQEIGKLITLERLSCSKGEITARVLNNLQDSVAAEANALHFELYQIRDHSLPDNITNVHPPQKNADTQNKKGPSKKDEKYQKRTRLPTVVAPESSPDAGGVPAAQ